MNAILLFKDVLLVNSNLLGLYQLNVANAIQGILFRPSLQDRKYAFKQHVLTLILLMVDAPNVMGAKY